MNTNPLNWSSESICLRPSSLDVSAMAADIYRRTCRVDFDSPGFCVLSLGDQLDSQILRQIMVDLKRDMASIHESKTDKSLVYLSAGRFDQQETTRPHLDGGPQECLLMLGYEPSAIDSKLEIYDYAKCAFDHKLSPRKFMAKYNPMFTTDYDILRPYCTPVPCFCKSEYQIICINNSCASYSESQPAWQGNLHKATILTPDESKRRVVNSMMIASLPAGTPDAINDEALNRFITASVVRRQTDNKPCLEDDK